MKRAAVERLRALQNPAVDRIARVLERSDDDALAVRAAQLVLDRTGLGPSARADVALSVESQLAELIFTLERDEMV